MKMKTTLFLSVMAAFLLFSCGKKEASLSGTKWGTTVQYAGMRLEVLLSFTSGSNGTLVMTDLNATPPKVALQSDFTYTYNAPKVLLNPTDPEFAADFPNGITSSVHGNVMDFSDFAKKYFGEDIDVALTKK